MRRSRPAGSASGLPRAALGMTLAHAGIAIFVAGAVGATWTVERIQVLKPGEAVEVAGSA